MQDINMSGCTCQRTMKFVKCVFGAFVLAFLLLLCLIKRIVTPIFNTLFVKRIAEIVRTPEGTFKGLTALGYPFAPHYVSLKVGGSAKLPRVNYVDEGPDDAQEVVICLHGEPSWSFLYRKMVPGFVSAGFRVIVPDFIGFGKSDKFTSIESYTHEMHTMTLRLLIEELGLENITVVCQDWGGLTGLAVVKDMPQRFSRIVVMNTGLPVGLTKDVIEETWNNGELIDLVHRSFAFLIWQASVKLIGNYLPVEFLFNKIVGFPKEVAEAYSMPFPSVLYKAGAAKWPLLVLSETVNSSMQETRDFIKKWKKPALVMFSDGDPITRGEEKFFLRSIPHAQHELVTEAGHFLQEEKGEELAENIIRFMSPGGGIS